MNAKEAASKGERKIFYYKYLTELQSKKLKEDGYDVEQASDRDGILVTIQW